MTQPTAPEAPLEAKVLDWLTTTGFPLEMEAASAFRGAGFDVRQSSTYADPQTDKGREIDVLATDPDWLGLVEIAFVLECKSSSKPWVVLTSDDALAGYNRLFAFGLLSGAARREIADRLLDLGGMKQLLERPDRGGYGFRQALAKESDPAYTAAMGALKACHDLAQDRVNSTIPKLAFAFPVIVVDSSLFECSLGTNGELALKEVQFSEFLFSAYIPTSVGCCVKVVTRQYLTAFAAEAKQLADAIRTEFRDLEPKYFPSLNATNG